jgi:hypothetical protein
VRSAPPGVGVAVATGGLSLLAPMALGSAKGSAALRQGDRCDDPQGGERPQKHAVPGARWRRSTGSPPIDVETTPESGRMLRLP